jgi:phosphate transport system substrate-binding protein
MKKTALVRLTKFTTICNLALAGIVLASCSKQPDATPPTNSGKVIIKGSNTIGEELAPRLIAEYKKDHSSASFELESKATGYGLAALMAGLCDLAGASRTPIKEELETAQSRNVELNDHLIGYYGVAVVVNPANAVAGLTRDQVRDIFTGVIQNWKEVGGADAPIHLFIRDAISGTHLGFQELAMENKPYASGATTSTNYAGISQGVAQNPNGIGYCSFDLVEKSGVKAVAIQDVPSSAASVRQGKYPYARALHFYTNKAAESPGALEFIQFVQSPRGQEILSQTGFVPRL